MPSNAPAEVDFVAFVMSLAASALIQMGETEGTTADQTIDLPLAKQTIDIIGMLRDKTRGNLTADEDRIVETLLYDLRLKFLRRNKPK